MSYPVQLAILSSILLLGVVKAQSTNRVPLRIDSVVIPKAANVGRSCPSNDILESARRNLTGSLQESLYSCGGTSWRQIADLNYSSPSITCPSPWVESLTPAKSCIANLTAAGCESVSFTISEGTYSRVCGRAVGYASNSPDAFAYIGGQGNSSIDSPYLDEVSVTYGSPRQHIWSFAAGHA